MTQDEQTYEYGDTLAEELDNKPVRIPSDYSAYYVIDSKGNRHLVRANKWHWQSMVDGDITLILWRWFRNTRKPYDVQEGTIARFKNPLGFYEAMSKPTLKSRIRRWVICRRWKR